MLCAPRSAPAAYTGGRTRGLDPPSCVQALQRIHLERIVFIGSGLLLGTTELYLSSVGSILLYDLCVYVRCYDVQSRHSPMFSYGRT